MVRSSFGAVRLPLLAAAVLASFAVDATAQVVERGRTFADLTASHPCASGLTERIARVTDCDAADDVGDGEGLFQCWVRCDGTAPWETVAIGGGAGGGAATAVTGSATLPATCAEKDLYQDTNSGGTEFYVCTAANTWTKAGTGDGTIGGTLTATDDLAVCTDGTGGSTIGACTVLNIDNLRMDLETITNTAGNPIYFRAGGVSNQLTIADSGISLGRDVAGTGTTTIGGYSVQLFARTQGVGAPLAMPEAASSQWSTNEGATAEVYVNLPSAAGGLFFSACVNDADGFRYTAASGDTIRVIDKVTAAAGYISSNTIGSCVTLVALNATEWLATSINGVFTDGTFTFDNTSLTTP